MTEPPERPGIEERSLEILERNTIAVLTSAPDRLDDWRATIAEALGDTLERSPDDVAEIALFQAILSLLDGGSPSLPEGHRYCESLGRILSWVEAPPDPYASLGGQFECEQLHALLQGTAGVFTGAVDREAWRAGLAHALRKAQDLGDTWAAEAELLQALIDLVDGGAPTLGEEHLYGQVLSDARSAAEVAQDPTVAALNAWINTDDGEALVAVWREHGAALRDPARIGDMEEIARAMSSDGGDADLTSRVVERIALLRACQEQGEDALG